MKKNPEKVSLQLFTEFQNKRKVYEKDYRKVYEKDYAIRKIKISLIKCQREYLKEFL